MDAVDGDSSKNRASYLISQQTFNRDYRSMQNQILVITIKDSVLDEVFPFTESEDAEKKFLELCREKIWNFDEYTPNDITGILDDGYAKYGANSICIHHL